MFGKIMKIWGHWKGIEKLKGISKFHLFYILYFFFNVWHFFGFDFSNLQNFFGSFGSKARMGLKFKHCLGPNLHQHIIMILSSLDKYKLVFITLQVSIIVHK